MCEEYKLDISPDTLRKAAVGIQLAYAAKVIPEDYTCGYAGRQMARDLAAQVNGVYRKEAKDELLREAVQYAVSKLPPMKPVTYSAPYTLNGEQELVLCLGDLHYGASFTVSGLCGEEINTYNADVFIDRMASLLDQTVDIIEKEEIAKVNLFLVGDLIDGMLRQSQLMRLQYGIVDSTIHLSEELANWINELSRYADVNVCACLGNHSEVRPIGSKKGDFPYENMERIVLWYLNARLSDNEHVKVNAEAKSYCRADVLGYSFLLLHGDAEKTLAEIATRSVQMYGKPIDFFVCGHLHREGELANGNSVVIRVPSLCGVDTYAASKGYNGKPGATAIVMERGYGRRCVYPINL